MAVISSSARYGGGIYGAAEYGVVDLSISLTGVQATASVENVQAGGFEVDITEVISAPATLTGLVAPVQVNVLETLSGVSATLAIGQLQFSNTVPLLRPVGSGVYGEAIYGTNLYAGSLQRFIRLGTVQANVKKPIIGVGATGTSGTVQVNITEILGSVSATGTVNNALNFSNTHNYTGPVAFGEVGSLTIDIIQPINGVAGTAEVYANFEYSTAKTVGSTVGAGVVNHVTAIGVQFNYGEFREQYDRRRTIKIPRAA